MAKIENRERLRRKLDKMPAAVREQIIAAIKKSADEINGLQRRLAPIRTGALRESIKNERETTARALYARSLSAGNAGSRIAHLVEHGTRPHTMRVRNAKVMGHRGQFGTVVEHPGTAPRPFFYPAFRAGKKRAVRRITTAMRKGLKQVASSR